jgi:hypothetical protein
MMKEKKIFGEGCIGVSEVSCSCGEKGFIRYGQWSAAFYSDKQKLVEDLFKSADREEAQAYTPRIHETTRKGHREAADRYRDWARGLQNPEEK